MLLEKTLSAMGRTFISAGTLVFLFVAYQLWGTNLAEARHQDGLKSDASALFAQANQTPAASAATKPANGVPANNTKPAPDPVAEGEALLNMQIPKIAFDKTIVEGTNVSDLKKGPGHYLNTPLPGQPGNAAIAGHRTTYGAPFNRLDELKIGDVINVRTAQGQFTYKVSGQKVVDPSDVSVLDPSNDNILTLTTCHPKFSAAQRLIITATLDTSISPVATASAIPASAKADSLPGPSNSETVGTDTSENHLGEANLSGTAESKTPALIWGLIAALSALLIYIIASRFYRRWPIYLLGSPVFLVLLYFFFENFSLLLPANA